MVRTSAGLRAGGRGGAAGRGRAWSRPPATGPADGAAFSGDFDDPPAHRRGRRPAVLPGRLPGRGGGQRDRRRRPGAGAGEPCVKNSRTTVAAPTYDAVSYGLNGHTCLVQPTSTGAAAGGGRPGCWRCCGSASRTTWPAQIVARLVNTADGTTDDPTPLTGAGVVQPYEALTRPLAPSTSPARWSGRSCTPTPTTRATAPEPADDLLASTREQRRVVGPDRRRPAGGRPDAAPGARSAPADLRRDGRRAPRSTAPSARGTVPEGTLKPPRRAARRQLGLPPRAHDLWWSSSDDGEGDLDVAAGGVGVGADLVGLLDELLGHGLLRRRAG